MSSRLSFGDRKFLQAAGLTCNTRLPGLVISALHMYNLQARVCYLFVTSTSWLRSNLHHCFLARKFIFSRHENCQSGWYLRRKCESLLMLAWQLVTSETFPRLLYFGSWHFIIRKYSRFSLSVNMLNVADLPSRTACHLGPLWSSSITTNVAFFLLLGIMCNSLQEILFEKCEWMQKWHWGFALSSFRFPRFGMIDSWIHRPL